MDNMPLIVQILILALMMYGLPVMAGGCFCAASGPDARRGAGSLVYRWISGQMFLWALFQMVCVPFVLLEKEFGYVVKVFGVVSLLAAALGFGFWLAGRKQAKLHVLPVADAVAKSPSRSVNSYRQYLLWVVFGGLLILQLVQAVRLAYGDGDDAYYVAVSTITEDAETMYRKLPYTGGSTNVDIRHGLAPFPIWIAFLARISGIPAVSVAHVAMPLMLIPLTYGIFYLLGRRLLANKMKLLPAFMILTAILVLFGDYSFYTAEHFMLARSRQGKAALGSVVLPMLLLMMFILLDKLQENEKLKISYWVLLCSVMVTGCLCSTMGAFLLCLMVAVTGLCAAVSYRRWKILLPLAFCCVPCMAYVLLYLMN